MSVTVLFLIGKDRVRKCLGMVLGDAASERKCFLSRLSPSSTFAQLTCSSLGGHVLASLQCEHLVQNPW